ncbi:MAG: UbiA family prenyltransferase [Verrucomicrobiota bacterium]
MSLLRPPSKYRTLLVMGRVCNVPTIWSNCLAGWWLGGGGRWFELGLLCVWVTLLYIGGMFLNDAFDANFDREHRRLRPIPSGAIGEKEVWQWGFAFLAGGAAGLVWAGTTTGILTLALTACILLYNATHRLAEAAPVLMGACRLLVYLVSASVARPGAAGSAEGGGMAGYPLWCGLALAAYVMGVSFLARKETRRGPVPFWPCIFMATPVVLAGLCDDGAAREAGNVLSLVLVVWTLWALRPVLWRQEPKVGHAVGRLMAGIIWVDLLAVGDLTQPWIGLFVLWFVLALLLQRYIPAA